MFRTNLPLRGRDRPPRQPVRTIPEDAPEDRVAGRSMSFHSSYDIRSGRSVPNAHHSFPRDIQRSNSTPNAGQEWRTRSRVDRTTDVPSQTITGSASRYGSQTSESYSGSPASRWSSAGGYDMISTVDPRPPESFTRPVSDESVEGFQSPRYSRSTSASTDEYPQQPYGNSSFKLDNGNHAPYDRQYSPTPLHFVDGRYETPRQVSENIVNTTFLSFQPSMLSSNGSISSKYYDQNDGRYQEQTTNSRWNIQQTGVHPELDAVSPRTIITEASSTTPDYDGHGPANYFTGYNSTNSHSETPHQTTHTPIGPRTYQEAISGSLGPYSQAGRGLLEHTDRMPEDTQYGPMPESRYQQHGGFTLAENDALSLASRTTAHDSIGSMTTSSELGDYTTTPLEDDVEIRRTHIDLRELLKEFQQQENPYRWEVKVWQDGTDQFLNRRVLLLDTQCEDSNWVSERIVNDLNAIKERLEYPAQFTTFNGELMTTEWETTLSFRKETDKVTIRTKFLVAVSGDVPFDMVLGASDIEKYNSVNRRTFLGLSHDKQTKEDKKRQAEREEEQRKRMARQLEKTKQMKEQKRRKDNERRHGESSTANRTGH